MYGRTKHFAQVRLQAEDVGPRDYGRKCLPLPYPVPRTCSSAINADCHWSEGPSTGKYSRYDSRRVRRFTI